MPPLSFNNNALARLFEVRQGLNYLLNEHDTLNVQITKLESEIKCSSAILALSKTTSIF